MILQHNLMANFTQRQLNINSNSKVKSTERLSSGYRINRASDDAAGLAISEKMRGQIRGLERAAQNVEDGISMIQVADGAMQEVTNMCQRMRELAVQAANDVNTEEDREIIQEEIDWLKAGINDIGRNTEFNTTKILQGKTLSDEWGEATLVDFKNEKSPELDASGNETGEKYYYFDDDPVYKGGFASASTIKATKTLDFAGVNNSNKHLLNGTGFSFRCTNNCDQVFEFQFVPAVPNPSNGNKYGILDTTPNADINQGGAQNSKKFQVGLDSFGTGSELVGNIMNYILEMNDDGTGVESLDSHAVGHANYLFIDGSKLILGGLANAAPGTSSNNYDFFTPLNIANIFDKIPLNLTIQSGANSAQEVKIPLPQVDTLTLGVDSCSVESHYAATATITAMDFAINSISAERARLGAYQNRLEHSVSNLSSSGENLQAAESRIRDADMAKEMTTNAKNNILEQAAQAMLAQAKKIPEGVLQLLQ